MIVSSGGCPEEVLNYKSMIGWMIVAIFLLFRVCEFYAIGESLFMESSLTFEEKTEKDNLYRQTCHPLGTEVVLTFETCTGSKFGKNVVNVQNPSPAILVHTQPPRSLLWWRWKLLLRPQGSFAEIGQFRWPVHRCRIAKSSH